jgi:hypothetical protein
MILSTLQIHLSSCGVSGKSRENIAEKNSEPSNYGLALDNPSGDLGGFICQVMKSREECEKQQLSDRFASKDMFVARQYLKECELDGTNLKIDGLGKSRSTSQIAQTVVQQATAVTARKLATTIPEKCVNEVIRGLGKPVTIAFEAAYAIANDLSSEPSDCYCFAKAPVVDQVVKDFRTLQCAYRNATRPPTGPSQIVTPTDSPLIGSGTVDVGTYNEKCEWKASEDPNIKNHIWAYNVEPNTCRLVDKSYCQNSCSNGTVCAGCLEPNNWFGHWYYYCANSNPFKGVDARLGACKQLCKGVKDTNGLTPPDNPIVRPLKGQCEANILFAERRGLDEKVFTYRKNLPEDCRFIAETPRGLDQ